MKSSSFRSPRWPRAYIQHGICPATTVLPSNRQTILTTYTKPSHRSQAEDSDLPYGLNARPYHNPKSIGHFQPCIGTKVALQPPFTAGGIVGFRVVSDSNFDTFNIAPRLSCKSLRAALSPCIWGQKNQSVQAEEGNRCRNTVVYNVSLDDCSLGEM
ncbi:hypothetical protein VFPPC_02682 [Pochonia chlamydosporia 170]|uniref:Uncharacterized protein n=1 Tax=Pochonia chlamydosporia 170 TaxID=1380566 RepID=A0A179FYX3_METCM|nr:hypothetical protein VFPPC_02682 [Pochonia chlamydosporia 170]OAQ70169.1 hypothetical protein VFPPC_02682 [Pochonia chlamydosporia 170]